MMLGFFIRNVIRGQDYLNAFVFRVIDNLVVGLLIVGISLCLTQSVMKTFYSPETFVSSTKTTTESFSITIISSKTRKPIKMINATPTTLIYSYDKYDETGKPYKVYRAFDPEKKMMLRDEEIQYRILLMEIRITLVICWIISKLIWIIRGKVGLSDYKDIRKRKVAELGEFGLVCFVFIYVVYKVCYCVFEYNHQCTLFHKIDKLSAIKSIQNVFGLETSQNVIDKDAYSLGIFVLLELLLACLLFLACERQIFNALPSWGRKRMSPERRFAAWNYCIKSFWMYCVPILSAHGISILTQHFLDLVASPINMTIWFIFVSGFLAWIGANSMFLMNSNIFQYQQYPAWQYFYEYIFGSLYIMNVSSNLPSLLLADWRPYKVGLVDISLVKIKGFPNLPLFPAVYVMFWFWIGKLYSLARKITSSTPMEEN